MANELLPCPFCGEEGHMEVGKWGYQVVCKRCSGRTAHGVDQLDAISAWNTRTEASHDPR